MKLNGQLKPENPLIIMRVIAKAPILIGPIFSKDFMLFSFALEHTIVGVLLQKDDEGFENPIAYFN